MAMSQFISTRVDWDLPGARVGFPGFHQVTPEGKGTHGAGATSRPERIRAGSRSVDHQEVRPGQLAALSLQLIRPARVLQGAKVSGPSGPYRTQVLFDSSGRPMQAHVDSLMFQWSSTGN